jgi:hypothetical protein
MRSAPNPARRRRILAASLRLATLTLLIAATGVDAGVIYVKPDATGMNNGTSWTDAYTDLQVALGAANSGDELWVVHATYTPHPTDRSVSFVIPDGVSLYGGFVGTETNLFERSNFFLTILSGEIGDPASTADNSYHVVDVSGTSASTLISSCAVTGGSADGAGPGQLYGGGVYCEGGNAELAEMYVHDNYASARGGGVYVSGGSPNITGVRTQDNTCGGDGGGIAVWNSNPTVRFLAAISNTASSGGGMFYMNSGGTSVSPTLYANSANFGGGGMFCYNSSPTIINARFSDNDADYGGGLVTGDASHVELINPTFHINTAVTTGGAIHCQVGSNPEIVNGILWNNSAGGGEDEIHVLVGGGAPVVSYTDIEGGIPPSVTDAGNNIDADPLFMYGERPGPLSPCIDAGDTGANPETIDAFVRPRVSGAAIDMGAIEFACPVGPVTYVDSGNYQLDDGTSWTSAWQNLRVGIDTAVLCPGVDEVWVAEGTYRTSPLPADRTLTFELVDGVAIYGGFAGTEAMLSERDWKAHPSVLTGQIGMSPDPSDNAYHVVTSNNNDATAVLDGFTISDGNADGGGVDNNGAGIHITGGGPTLRNLIIENNTAASAGGGMITTFSAVPEVRDVVFRANSASSGAGVFNSGTSPTFLNVIFDGNTATGNGGGMNNFGGGDPQMANVVFFDNTANFGGGMSNEESSPLLINVTFGGNTANVRGGAMFNVTLSSPLVGNSVLYGNTASQGNEVYNELSGGAPTPGFVFCLVAGSGGSGVGWDPTLGTDYGNNIDADPLYFDLPGGDLRLQNLSPALNIGDTGANPEPYDVAGNPRVVGAAIDLGAYEFPAPVGAHTPDIGAGTGIRSVHPNPFNPTITIDYAVREEAHVTLEVYDVRGALVGTLVDGRVAPGTRSVQWHGTDARGHRVSSGVYLVRMVAGREVSMRKIVMLK